MEPGWGLLGRNRDVFFFLVTVEFFFGNGDTFLTDKVDRVSEYR